MEKSLRRKKKRLRAKKSYESQLQQQRSLLAAATSDQDRKRISERIQSLTRLWKRKQQIWWSEDQVRLVESAVVVLQNSIQNVFLLSGMDGQ